MLVLWTILTIGGVMALNMSNSTHFAISKEYPSCRNGKWDDDCCGTLAKNEVMLMIKITDNSQGNVDVWIDGGKVDKSGWHNAGNGVFMKRFQKEPFNFQPSLQPGHPGLFGIQTTGFCWGCIGRYCNDWQNFDESEIRKCMTTRGFIPSYDSEKRHIG